MRREGFSAKLISFVLLTSTGVLVAVADPDCPNLKEEKASTDAREARMRNADNFIFNIVSRSNAEFNLCA